MATMIKFAVSGCFCLLLLQGFYYLIFDLYPNHCEMTYMYQLPEYIEIPMNKSTLKYNFPYKLYAYGEGIHAESLKHNEFNGIPVLFIPGNGGSYKQVRSAASVALRKSIKDRNVFFHFDFFSTDFNEQLSALSGPLLDAETEYVKLCLHKILSLYKEAGLKRSSVVLIGHSLGGMVAMGAAADTFLSSRISLIINLAVPLSRPVAIVDSAVDSFYTKVLSYWTNEKYRTLKHITVVSIGGGRNDFQVPTLLTSSNLVDVDTSTLSVPACWLTTDHRAMVWCKQLVMATVRALFNSVDPELMSLNQNKDVVQLAFEYHLLERSRSKKGFKRKFVTNLTKIQGKGMWAEAARRQEHFEIKKESTTSFIMIPIHKDKNYHKHLAIVGREFDWNDWVFACKLKTDSTGSKKCVHGENLSNKGIRIPGSRKEVNVKLKPIFKKGFDYIVVWLQKVDDMVTLDIDVSDGFSRCKEVKAPLLMSHFFPTLITEATPLQALTYNISITGITEAWQSYVLTLNKLHRCDDSSKLPIVKIRPSWMTRWDIVLSGPSESEFIIEVDTSYEKRNDNSTVEVHIILDTSCTYNISLQTNPPGIFKRVALIYGPQIPAYMACHLLLALSNQLKVIKETNSCPSTFSSLIMLTPLSMLPFVTLLDYIFGMLQFDTDFQLMNRLGIDIGLFPIFLFFSTIPLTFVTASLVWVAVVIWGKAAYYYAERYLKCSLGVGEIATNVVMHGLNRYPIVFAVALIAIATVTCSNLAFVFAFLYYFVKMFKLYEDYLEKIITNLVRLPSKKDLVHDLSSINLNFTLMLLVLLLAALTSPGLIDWLLQGKMNLIYDPNLLITVCILISLGFVWQIKLAQRSVYYGHLSTFLKLMAILVILFGSVTMHKVIIAVGVAIIAVSVQQLVASATKESSPDSEDELDANRSDVFRPDNESSTHHVEGEIETEQSSFIGSNELPPDDGIDEPSPIHGNVHSSPQTVSGMSRISSSSSDTSVTSHSIGEASSSMLVGSNDGGSDSCSDLSMSADDAELSDPSDRSGGRP